MDYLEKEEEYLIFRDILSMMVREFERLCF